MRKQKSIKIDDREITVFELCVKDINRFLEKAGALSEKATAPDLLAFCQEVFPRMTTLNPSELEELAPSEIETIWDGFKEVNASFLGVLKRTGALELFGKEMKQILKAALAEQYAYLSPGGTPIPGTTAGAGS